MYRAHLHCVKARCSTLGQAGQKSALTWPSDHDDEVGNKDDIYVILIFWKNLISNFRYGLRDGESHFFFQYDRSVYQNEYVTTKNFDPNVI